MKKISIIGFGRFGQTLYRLLKDDFNITVYSRSIQNINIKEFKNLKIAKSINEVYLNETVFIAVPISSFEEVIKKHKKYFTANTLLIDVLSVKMHPKNILTKYLKNTLTQAILTHPMFGPDSSKNGFKDLPVIIEQFKSDDDNYNFWLKYFKNKGLKVVEMSAKEHDLLAAKSQGVVHFMGRLLEKINYQPTPIDSLGSKKLMEIKEQTCNDTWQLFHDLQTLNPYTKKLRIKLGKAYDELYDQLLPKRLDRNNIIFGIQGGKDSFNEQAVLKYIQTNNIKKYKIRYLFTTQKVLKKIHEGNIDFGLFAITNSVGGLVEESLNAMSKYKYSVAADFEILIKHFLMARQDVDLNKLNTIMAHPQVLIQCQNSLKTRFPHFKLISGKGDAIDTAKSAELLAKGKIDKYTAILGPVGLAKRHNLKIIAENLQDKNDNYTRFLLIKR